MLQIRTRNNQVIGSGENGAYVKRVPILWTPAQMTTEIWFDASDTSTITIANTALGYVSQWDDKSGNGISVIQPTAARQPKSGTRTMNKLNVVDFQGSDAAGDTLYTTLVSPATANWLLVAAYDADQEPGITYSTILRCAGWWGFYHAISSRTYGYSNSAQRGALVDADTGTQIISWSIDNGNNNYNGAVYKNGTVMNNGMYSIGQDIDGLLVIGGLGASGYHNWNGGMGELILVRDDTSTATRQKLEGYLAWRWGMQSKLKETHPYKLAPPEIAS